MLPSCQTLVRLIYFVGMLGSLAPLSEQKSLQPSLEEEHPPEMSRNIYPIYTETPPTNTIYFDKILSDNNSSSLVAFEVALRQFMERLVLGTNFNGTSADQITVTDGKKRRTNSRIQPRPNLKPLRGNSTKPKTPFKNRNGAMRNRTRPSHHSHLNKNSAHHHRVPPYSSTKKPILSNTQKKEGVRTPSTPISYDTPSNNGHKLSVPIDREKHKIHSYTPTKNQVKPNQYHESSLGAQFSYNTQIVDDQKASVTVDKEKHRIHSYTPTTNHVVPTHHQESNSNTHFNYDTHSIDGHKPPVAANKNKDRLHSYTPSKDRVVANQHQESSLDDTTSTDNHKPMIVEGINKDKIHSYTPNYVVPTYQPENTLDTPFSYDVHTQPQGDGSPIISSSYTSKIYNQLSPGQSMTSISNKIGELPANEEEYADSAVGAHNSPLESRNGTIQEAQMNSEKGNSISDKLLSNASFDHLPANQSNTIHKGHDQDQSDAIVEKVASLLTLPRKNESISEPYTALPTTKRPSGTQNKNRYQVHQAQLTKANRRGPSANRSTRKPLKRPTKASSVPQKEKFSPPGYKGRPVSPNRISKPEASPTIDMSLNSSYDPNIVRKPDRLSSSNAALHYPHPYRVGPPNRSSPPPSKTAKPSHSTPNSKTPLRKHHKVNPTKVAFRPEQSLAHSSLLSQKPHRWSSSNGIRNSQKVPPTKSSSHINNLPKPPLKNTNFVKDSYTSSTPQSTQRIQNSPKAPLKRPTSHKKPNRPSLPPSPPQYLRPPVNPNLPENPISPVTVKSTYSDLKTTTPNSFKNPSMSNVPVPSTDKPVISASPVAPSKSQSSLPTVLPSEPTTPLSTALPFEPTSSLSLASPLELTQPLPQTPNSSSPSPLPSTPNSHSPSPLPSTPNSSSPSQLPSTPNSPSPSPLPSTPYSSSPSQLPSTPNSPSPTALPSKANFSTSTASPHHISQSSSSIKAPSVESLPASTSSPSPSNSTRTSTPTKNNSAYYSVLRYDSEPSHKILQLPPKPITLPWESQPPVTPAGDVYLEYKPLQGALEADLKPDPPIDRPTKTTKRIPGDSIVQQLEFLQMYAQRIQNFNDIEERTKPIEVLAESEEKSKVHLQNSGNEDPNRKTEKDFFEIYPMSKRIPMTAANQVTKEESVETTSENFANELPKSLLESPLAVTFLSRASADLLNPPLDSPVQKTANSGAGHTVFLKLPIEKDLLKASLTEISSSTEHISTPPSEKDETNGSRSSEESSTNQSSEESYTYDPRNSTLTFKEFSSRDPGDDSHSDPISEGQSPVSSTEARINYKQNSYTKSSTNEPLIHTQNEGSDHFIDSRSSEESSSYEFEYPEMEATLSNYSEKDFSLEQNPELRKFLNRHFNLKSIKESSPDDIASEGSGNGFPEKDIQEDPLNRTQTILKEFFGLYNLTPDKKWLKDILSTKTSAEKFSAENAAHEIDSFEGSGIHDYDAFANLQDTGALMYKPKTENENSSNTTVSIPTPKENTSSSAFQSDSLVTRLEETTNKSSLSKSRPEDTITNSPLVDQTIVDEISSRNSLSLGQSTPKHSSIGDNSSKISYTEQPLLEQLYLNHPSIAQPVTGLPSIGVSSVISSEDPTSTKEDPILNTTELPFTDETSELNSYTDKFSKPEVSSDEFYKTDVVYNISSGSKAVNAAKIFKESHSLTESYTEKSATDERSSDGAKDEQMSSNESSTDKSSTVQFFTESFIEEPVLRISSTKEALNGRLPTDKRSTYKRFSDKSSTAESSTDKISIDKSSTNKISTDKNSTDKIFVDNFSTDESSTSKIINNELSSDTFHSEKSSLDKLSSNSYFSDEFSITESTTDKSAEDESLKDESTEKYSTDKIFNDEFSPDNFSSEESLSDDPSLDISFAEESSTNESSTDQPVIDTLALSESSTPKFVTDGSSTNESNTEKSPTDESPTEKSTTDGSRTDESPTEKSPTDESRTDEFPTEKPSADESRTDDTLTEKSPTDESRTDEFPTEKSSADESPTEKSPIAESPTEKSPTDGSRTNRFPANEFRTEKSPIDESPTEKSPTDGSRTDESPTEKSPTDGSRTDESPTEKSSTDESRTDEPPTYKSTMHKLSIASLSLDESNVAEIATDATSANESSSNESPIKISLINESYTDEAPINESSKVKIATNRISVNVSLPDQTPTEVSPTDQTPSYESPMDVASTDVTPTDVSTTEVSPMDLTPTGVTPMAVSPTDAPPTDMSPTNVNPTDESPTNESSTNEPPADEPSITDSPLNEFYINEPSIDESSSKKSFTAKSTAPNEYLTDTSATEKSSYNQSPTKDSLIKKSSTDESGISESSSADIATDQTSFTGESLRKESSEERNDDGGISTENSSTKKLPTNFISTNSPNSSTGRISSLKNSSTGKAEPIKSSIESLFSQKSSTSKPGHSPPFENTNEGFQRNKASNQGSNARSDYSEKAIMTNQSLKNESENRDTGLLINASKMVTSTSEFAAEAEKDRNQFTEVGQRRDPFSSESRFGPTAPFEHPLALKAFGADTEFPRKSNHPSGDSAALVSLSVSPTFKPTSIDFSINKEALTEPQASSETSVDSDTYFKQIKRKLLIEMDLKSLFEFVHKVESRWETGEEVTGHLSLKSTPPDSKPETNIISVKITE